MHKIKVTYFFRKQQPEFHSIEELFANFQKFLPENIDFQNVYLPYHNGFIGRLKNLLFVRKYKSQINHITGDVNYIALALPKKGTILTIHDIGSALKFRGVKLLIIRLFWFVLPFLKVQKITTISNFSKNEILRRFNVKAEKIEVIDNCFSDKFNYVEKKTQNKKQKILIIGTKSNKNLPRYFEALKDISCKLIIIGKLTENQRNMIEKYNFDFENYFNLPFDEVVKKYQEVDILLFASLYEGFGVPVLEAQASGLPVITSNIEPMKTIAGKGAVFVNPENISEIRNAVMQLLDNEGIRRDLVAKGLENVKKYTCRAIAKKYAELYERLSQI